MRAGRWLSDPDRARVYFLEIWIAEPRLSNSIERLKEGREQRSSVVPGKGGGNAEHRRSTHRKTARMQFNALKQLMECRRAAHRLYSTSRRLLRPLASNLLVRMTITPGFGFGRKSPRRISSEVRTDVTVVLLLSWRHISMNRMLNSALDVGDNLPRRACKYSNARPHRSVDRSRRYRIVRGRLIAAHGRYSQALFFNAP